MHTTPFGRLGPRTGCSDKGRQDTANRGGAWHRQGGPNRSHVNALVELHGGWQVVAQLGQHLGGLGAQLSEGRYAQCAVWLGSNTHLNPGLTVIHMWAGGDTAGPAPGQASGRMGRPALHVACWQRTLFAVAPSPTRHGFVFRDVAVSDTFLLVCLSGILSYPPPGLHPLHTSWPSLR